MGSDMRGIMEGLMGAIVAAERGNVTVSQSLCPFRPKLLERPAGLPVLNCNCIGYSGQMECTVAVVGSPLLPVLTSRR